MPLKIIHANYYEILGRGRVLLSSPPILGTISDLHTGTLTEEVALLSKCHAIIGKEKKLADPSELESVQSEFLTGARELIADHGIMAILEIRGKKEPGLELKIGTSEPEAGQIAEIVKTAFAMSFPVEATELGPGEQAPYFNTKEVQILALDLGPEERSFQRESIIDIAAETVGLINRKLGFSDRDDGPSNTLD